MNADDLSRANAILARLQKSDLPGERLGDVPYFASDEFGARRPVSVTPLSPVSVPEGGQATSLPGPEAVSNPSPGRSDYGGGCDFTLMDLAGVGQGVTPNGYLQDQAQQLDQSYAMRDQLHDSLSQQGLRGTDFTRDPVSPAPAPDTPPAFNRGAAANLRDLGR